MLCVGLVNIIYACMHIHHRGHSIHRAGSLNKGERVAEPSNHPSLCLLEVVWEGGRSAVCAHVCVSVCLHAGSFSLNPLSTIPEALAPPLLLEPCQYALCHLHSAQRTAALGWVQGAARPPSLPLPLIHSFGRQNPSPLSTCLTEGKNRDEIAGLGSIPSILFSISAVIHQLLVVVVDVGGVVLA